MPPPTCPACGGNRFHKGTLYEATTFRPDEHRSLLSFGPTTAAINGFACESCGVLTLKVDPADLRAALGTAK